jgi:AmmeMemoRadiSam system protein A
MKTSTADAPAMNRPAIESQAAPAMPADRLGAALLAIARSAIAGRLGVAAPTPARDEVPDTPAATFVTLTRDGLLRGCIGSLEARRPLAFDVAENALAAAFRDPRFPPLTATEWPAIRIEVSLLTPAETLSFSSEADALARLRPGIDGVVLQAGGRRATFLPQVWESLPDPADFLARLKEKAGLPAGYWSDTLRLSRYAVKKWREEDPAT